MEPLTIIVMIIVLTIVWGGFIFILLTAIKKEREKTGGSAN